MEEEKNGFAKHAAKFYEGFIAPSIESIADNKTHIRPDSPLPGSEPSKKRKKKPTGILKDLLELKRYDVAKMKNGELVLVGKENGQCTEWSDIEKIINKYL